MQTCPLIYWLGLAILGTVLCGGSPAPAAGAAHTAGFAHDTARPDTVQTDSLRIAAPFLYRVREGDTLYGIARRHGLTVEGLQRLNGLHDAPLRAGQGLLVRLPDDAWQTFYTVKPGDTIFYVARHHGLTPTQLKQLNALTTAVLRPGQRLAVPRRLSETAPTVEPAETPPPPPDTPPAAAPPRRTPQALPDTTAAVPAAVPDTLHTAAPPPPAAPGPTADGVLKVFLDCDPCDKAYLRQQIDFVNYVRDRQDADVHLLITVEAAGGGQAFTLAFLGRHRYAALRDTLQYASSSTDTDDERRAGLARTIRLGLARYLARTPQAAHFTVRRAVDAPARRATPEDDPWNSWVFRIGADGSYDEEESTNFLRLQSTVSASRVTKDWKLQLSGFGSYRESHFDVGDETIESTTRNGSAQGLAVRSLGGHGAAGGFAAVSTSSFNNTDLSVTASPALEFNVFPYSESTRREFRFSYFVNLRYFDYEQVTAFGKTTDLLLHHALEATLDVKQPWGSAQLSLEGSTYLYDFDGGEDLLDLYRVELFGFVELRLVRGLSFYAHGGASWIRDQRFLPAKEASQEDILLGNVRLPTSYTLTLSAGLSYTFGSIYNNVVNARFGS